MITCVAGNRCFAQRADKSRHPDSLITVQWATKPIYTDQPRGGTALTYTVPESYPADDAITFIREALRKKGWKPLKEDFMNPGLPTSESRGWDQFDDATHQPPTHVYQWMGDWENNAHDITRYSFEYFSNLRVLHVAALYIPADTAAQMKRDAARNLPH